MDESELPPKLELDGSYAHLISMLYEVFERDFLQSRANFHGLPVVVDCSKVDSELEEGFWHVITRDDSPGRLLDYKRAKRLPWLRPLIEHAPDPDVFCWTEDELDRRRGQMRKKHYVWYEPGDYLIILKEIPKRYFLATAFHVTGQREYDYFMRKYEAQKKGTGY